MEEQLHTTQEEQTEVVVDEQKLATYRQYLSTQQSVTMGTLGGFCATVLAALVWTSITIATNYQIGYMAVAVGYVVGTTVRIMGKGIDAIFGYVGAAMAFLGCFLGNFLSLIHFLAEETDKTYLEILSTIEYGFVADLMLQTSNHIDLLFYGIAIYEGYKFSFRTITVEEVEAYQGH